MELLGSHPNFAEHLGSGSTSVPLVESLSNRKVICFCLLGLFLQSCVLTTVELYRGDNVFMVLENNGIW